MTDQASKRPWINNPEYEGTLIKSVDGQTICEIELPIIKKIGYDGCTEIQSANANLIVKCVNVHDELVEALKNIVSRSEGDDVLMASDISNLAKLALSHVGELYL